MPTPVETPFRVFYSWQSDLPTIVNLKLIRSALSKASVTMNDDPGLNLHVVIDEATREIPGSPNIADSIFEKIRAADVFICDLTKVAEAENDEGNVRKYSNPNVALELGYAVRVLGWRRIIILFNLAYGTIPDDLPFDASGHRATPYTCKAEYDVNRKPTPSCESQISNAVGDLRGKLIGALQLIAKERPLRPHEIEQKSPEKIKRERDLKQITDVFYWIHLGSMDRFIEQLPNGYVLDQGIEFFECLLELVSQSSFHISDSDLSEKLKTFMEVWGKCFDHTISMDLHRNGRDLYFRMPGDVPVSDEQATQFRYISSLQKPLRNAFSELISYIRSHFIEIDLTLTGREALAEYSKRQKEDELMV
jgi:hypothetical protein